MQRRLARAFLVPAAAVPLALAAPTGAAAAPLSVAPASVSSSADSAQAKLQRAPLGKDRLEQDRQATPGQPRAEQAQRQRAQLQRAQRQRAQLRRAQLRKAQLQRAQQARRAAALRLTYRVQDLQRQLRRAGVYTGPVDGIVTGWVGRSLRRAQDDFGLPHSSALDPASLGQLRTANMRARSAPARCRTPGKVLCIDKSRRVVQAVHNGRVVMQADARFGRSSMPTREGTFRVGRKSANHVSGAYGSAMPYSMFFWRGQAVHYSSGFARVGYRGTSHGCVNLRSMTMPAKLFRWAPSGTRVVIFRS